MAVALGAGSYNVRRDVLHLADGGHVDVAILTKRVDACTIRQSLARAQRLAAALMQIAHPNVERLLRTNYPGRPGFCLVVAWPDGGDLRMFLAANPGADVLPIARMIAQAVQHLHTNNPRIIHGNIDLSSVFMHGHTPRLWDFSLCRLEPSPDASPLADSTPAAGVDWEGMITSIAPECYSAGRVTPASDVYAFGLLLFELFARHRPFPSSNRLHAAMLLHEGRRPLRKEIQSGLRGDAVWDIITRCWAQDAAERADMARVAVDLQLVP